MQFSSRRASRRELGAINVTSLVDIIFNLLLFFMLTTSFSESAGLEVELPEASSADVKVRTGDLTVALTRDGEIVVRGVVVSLPELEEIMQKHKEEHGEAALIVQADAEVPHGRVVEVVDRAKKQGFPRLGIAAQGGK
jgi:biopolymer transport protein ExbD